MAKEHNDCFPYTESPNQGVRHPGTDTTDGSLVFKKLLKTKEEMLHEPRFAHDFLDVHYARMMMDDSWDVETVRSLYLRFLAHSSMNGSPAEDGNQGRDINRGTKEEMLKDRDLHDVLSPRSIRTMQDESWSTDDVSDVCVRAKKLKKDGQREEYKFQMIQKMENDPQQVDKMVQKYGSDEDTYAGLTFMNGHAYEDVHKEYAEWQRNRLLFAPDPKQFLSAMLDAKNDASTYSSVRGEGLEDTSNESKKTMLSGMFGALNVLSTQLGGGPSKNANEQQTESHDSVMDPHHHVSIDESLRGLENGDLVFNKMLKTREEMLNDPAISDIFGEEMLRMLWSESYSTEDLRDLYLRRKVIVGRRIKDKVNGSGKGDKAIPASPSLSSTSITKEEMLNDPDVRINISPRCISMMQDDPWSEEMVLAIYQRAKDLSVQKLKKQKKVQMIFWMKADRIQVKRLQQKYADREEVDEELVFMYRHTYENVYREFQEWQRVSIHGQAPSPAQLQQDETTTQIGGSPVCSVDTDKNEKSETSTQTKTDLVELLMNKADVSKRDAIEALAVNDNDITHSLYWLATRREPT